VPQQYTYPGVYVEEVQSGVRTIAGVSTSDTAFVDFFARGPVNKPVRVTSFGDFERIFGGLWLNSTLGYAVVGGILLFAAAWYLIAKQLRSASGINVDYAFKEIPPE